MYLLFVILFVIVCASFLDTTSAIKDCLDVNVGKCSLINRKGEVKDCSNWNYSNSCDVSVMLEYTVKNKLIGDEPSTVIIFETRNIDSNINKIERKQGEVFNFTVYEQDVNLCQNPIYSVTIFAKAVHRNSTEDIDLQELCEIVYNDFNLPVVNISRIESHDYYEFKCARESSGQSKYVKQSSKPFEVLNKERTPQGSSSVSVATNRSAQSKTGGSTLEPSMQVYPSSEPSILYNSSSLLPTSIAPSAVPSISPETSKTSLMPSNSLLPSQSAIPSHHLDNISIVPQKNETSMEENSCTICMDLMKHDIRVNRDASMITLYFSLIILSESNSTGFLLENDLLEVLNGIFKAEFLGCNENETSGLSMNSTGLVLADFQDMKIDTTKHKACSFLERESKESECQSAIGKVQVHYVGLNTESDVSYKVLQLLSRYSDWVVSYIDEVHGLYFDAITPSKDLLLEYSTSSRDRSWVIPAFMLSIILMIIAGLLVIHFKGKKLWMKLEDDAIKFSDRLYPDNIPIPMQITKKELPEDFFSDITDEEENDRIR